MTIIKILQSNTTALKKHEYSHALILYVSKNVPNLKCHYTKLFLYGYNKSCKINIYLLYIFTCKSSIHLNKRFQRK